MLLAKFQCRRRSALCLAVTFTKTGYISFYCTPLLYFFSRAFSGFVASRYCSVSATLWKFIGFVQTRLLTYIHMRMSG